MNKAEKKKTPSLFYRVSAWLHLWLGLFTGIVVFIVSLTGALLVFEQELRVWLQPYQTVNAAGKAFLPPSQLKQAAMNRYHLPAVSAVVYQGINRAAVVPYYGDRKKYQLVYINPYTGQILHYQLLKKDFYRIVLEGHYNLWLPRAIGKPLVAYATLIFVITLITGLVLWWPKRWSKNTVRHSFLIKWNGNFKRINYDVHNVLGFYSIAIALILGLTGMVYGMQWFSKAVYWGASGGNKESFVQALSDSTLKKTSATPDEDVLFKQLVSKRTDLDHQFLTIGYPFGKKGVWRISLAPNGGKRLEERTDIYEQVSLKKLNKPLQAGEERGEKIMRLNYDLHVGSVGGFTTKVIAFLVCIICASLPVTGFIIWLGKRKKKPKAKKIHHVIERRTRLAN